MKGLILLTLVSLAVSGCAVEGKGILLAVEPATPLDGRDLHKHCDLGDQAACALSQREGANRPASRFAVIQGLATPDRAVFAAVLPKDSNVSWFIYDRDVGRLWKLHDSRKQRRPGLSSYVQRVEARDLEPGRSYELLAGDKDGNLVEDRTFRTLSGDGLDLRFAAVSGLVAGPGGLVSAVKERKPHFVLFSGGNVDALFPKKAPPVKKGAALDWFFERHLAARQALSLAKERELVPVVATWNDTEFGIADGDRSFAFRDQAREVFEMFFPVWADESTIVNGPGVAKSFPFAGQRIALLDPLSFRHPNLALPSCTTLKAKARRGKQVQACHEASAQDTSRSRFGSMQAAWIANQSAKFTVPTWLVSPHSWLGVLRGPGSGSPSASEPWLAQLEASAGPPLTSPSQLSVVEASAEGKGLKIRIISLGALGQELSSRQVSLP